MKNISIFILLCFFSSNLFAYFSVEEYAKKDVDNAVFLSVLFPGLGQFSLDEKEKAYFFSIFETLCLIGAFYSYSNARSDYNKYELEGDKNSDLHNSYSDNIDQMYVFIGLGLINWGLNIFDICKNVSINKNLKISLINDNINVSYSKKY